MGRYKELAYTIAENLAKLDMALNDGKPAENVYPIRLDAVEPDAPVYWAYVEFYDRMLNGSLDEFLEPKAVEAYQPEGVHPIESTIESFEDILRNFGDEENDAWNLFTYNQLHAAITVSDVFKYLGMQESRWYNIQRSINKIQRLQQPAA